MLPFTLTVSDAAPGSKVIVRLDIFAISTTTVVWTFLNPAASVRGVKDQVIEGKTPEILRTRTGTRDIDVENA